MNFWDIITSNKIMNVVILSWLIASSLKVLVILITTKKFDFSRFWGSGGMPSTHSATVVSLATYIGRMQGVESPIFAVALTLALVVMYDAMGVRQSAGKQAQILNKILENWDFNDPDFIGIKLKELIGHTPSQVMAGAVLGFIVAMIAPV